MGTKLAKTYCVLKSLVNPHPAQFCATVLLRWEFRVCSNLMSRPKNMFFFLHYLINFVCIFYTWAADFTKVAYMFACHACIITTCLFVD